MQWATYVPCQTRRRGPKRHARSRQSRPKPAFVHPNACAHEPPHWATYNNIPYRLSDIVGMARCRDDVSPMDSSLRTLQRTLLLVAAYCRFEAVDKGWHDLVDVALDGNTKLGMDGLDSVLELLSGMREVEQHDEGIYPEALPNDAGAREMVLVMLMARLAGRRMAPPLKGPQLDALTYAAGESYIGQFKIRKWRRLERCWRARAAAIRWHRQAKARLAAQRRKRVRVAARAAAQSASRSARRVMQGGAQPRFWWIARRPRRGLSLGEQEGGSPWWHGGFGTLVRTPEHRAHMTNLVRT